MFAPLWLNWWHYPHQFQSPPFVYCFVFQVAWVNAEFFPCDSLGLTAVAVASQHYDIPETGLERIPIMSVYLVKPKDGVSVS